MFKIEDIKAMTFDFVTQRIIFELKDGSNKAIKSDYTTFKEKSGKWLTYLSLY